MKPNPNPHPETALQIRDRLLELIGADLGKWRDGSPAIFIGVPPIALAPAVGIQCVIDAIAESKPVPFIGGGVGHPQLFRVTLKNIPAASQTTKPATAKSLAYVVSKLITWSELREPLYIPGGDVAEQYTFKVFAPMIAG